MREELVGFCFVAGEEDRALVEVFIQLVAQGLVRVAHGGAAGVVAGFACGCVVENGRPLRFLRVG